MRRFFAVHLLCLALACSSSNSNNDAAGTGGSGATAGTSGSAGTSGTAGTTGAGGNSGTTGSSGRGGGSGGSTGAGGTGVHCLAYDSPGLVRGAACPNTTPPCYAACDFDGDEYTGCISGSTEFTECYPSCGACP